jgi:hypothetical protein
MKRIQIEITVEHMGDGDEVDESLIDSPPDETATMSLSKFTDDVTPSTDTVDNLAAELARRYRTINARKTN